MKDQLANSEIKLEMQLQRIATLEAELASDRRMNDLRAQTYAGYENDLHFITRELEDKKKMKCYPMNEEMKDQQSFYFESMCMCHYLLYLSE